MVNPRSIYFRSLVIFPVLLFLVFIYKNGYSPQIRGVLQEKFSLNFVSTNEDVKPIQESLFVKDFLQNITKLNWTYRLMSHSILHRDKSSNDTEFKVPNVVHFVWLGSDLTFKFLHYISFLSVHRFIKPDAIFVYGEEGPKGEWWERVRGEVSNVYHVKAQGSEVSLNGQKFRYKAHSSDLLRTQVVYELGGIYMDADVFVLKSFDPLRVYSTVMGRERVNGLCNGIIIAEPRAPFVKMLLDQYNTYQTNSESWAGKSVEAPHRMALQHPNLIHVEETSLHIPSWYEVDKIFDKIYDWKNNYAIHLWVRKMYEKNRSVANSIEDINCAKTTLGQISRYIYYGSSELVEQCSKT